VVVASGESGVKPVVIEAMGVEKSFGANKVLRGVSLAALEGEVVSIVGASGSGKSTLLRCFPLLEIPDAGDVAIAGEVLALTERGGRRVPRDMGQVQRVRAELGFVFQSFNLWPHRTVLGNVIEAPVHVQKRPRAECTAEAEALLEKVGLADKRDAWPAQLSGGQQQRAAIARALAMRPKALLFDEPTSALDPELVGEVLRVIRGLAEEGRTMLIVTHEMAFAAEVSSRALFLDAGIVGEEGPPGQIFQNPQTERCRAFVSRHLARG
jgi:octopine/nopaline transport system ATP-binding protein